MLNLVAQQHTLCPRVLLALFTYDQAEAPADREAYDPDFVDEDAPVLTVPEDLVRLLSASELQLRSIDASGEVTAGLSFACTWGMEHGVSVRLRDSEIVEVGGAELVL